MKITEELLEWKSSGSWSRKPRLTTLGIRCTDHATPLAKVALTSPTGGGRSVGIGFSFSVSTSIFLIVTAGIFCEAWWVRRGGYVARMGEKKSAYKVLTGKSEGRIPF
jgi:hypothetical protein